MTLAPMHLMFQVSIDFCDHFSANMFGESMFTYSCACLAEVAANAMSKLHSQNCGSYWKLEVSIGVPRLESNYVSICKFQPVYFVMAIFGEAFIMIGESFAKHNL